MASNATRKNDKNTFLTPRETVVFETPRTPDVKRYHPNRYADENTPLTPYYGRDELVQGIVNPSKHNKLIIPYPEAAWLEDNDNYNIWQSNGPTKYLRATQETKRPEIPNEELLRKDGSNRRVNSELVARSKKGRPVEIKDIDRSYQLNPVDLRKASGAGNILGSANLLREAMGNWVNFVNKSITLDSWYDTAIDVDKVKSKDAAILSAALAANNGDIRKTFNEVEDQLSDEGKRALYTIIGLYSSKENEEWAGYDENVKNRFFNANDAAGKLYYETDEFPERRAGYFNLQFATDEEKRKFYSHQTPEERLRFKHKMDNIRAEQELARQKRAAELGVDLSKTTNGQSNVKARGGRLPKAPTRDKYGNKIARADNLSTRDYDVYF